MSASFEGRVPLPLPHTSSSSSLAGFQPRSDAPSPATQAPDAGSLNGSLYSEVRNRRSYVCTRVVLLCVLLGWHVGLGLASAPRACA